MKSVLFLLPLVTASMSVATSELLKAALKNDTEGFKTVLTDHPKLICAETYNSLIHIHRFDLIPLLNDHVDASAPETISDSFRNTCFARNVPEWWIPKVILPLAAKWKCEEDAAVSYLTPLMIAVQVGSMPLINHLLEVPNIRSSINVPDQDRFTAAHHASTVQVIHALYKNGADLSLLTKDGKTLLHIFVEKMQPEIKVVQKYHQENWPAANDYLSSSSLIRKRVKMMKYCVLQGLDLYSLDKDGVSLLFSLGDDDQDSLKKAAEIWKRVKFEQELLKQEYDIGPDQSHVGFLLPELYGCVNYALEQPIRDAISELLSS